MAIGVGLIGFGPWGQVLYRECMAHDAFELICLHDRNESHQQHAASLQPAPRVLSSPEEVIHHPKVDVVMIATQMYEHKPLVFQSLKAGRHVWLEKPPCHHRTDAKQMDKMARKEKRTLFVDHTQIYCSTFAMVKERVQSGALGRIRQVRSWRANFGRFASDTDVLGQLLYHDIYLVQNLFPQAEPLRVNSSGIDLMVHGQWDTVTGSILLSNGVMVEMQASLTHPEKVQSMTILGDKGVLIWEEHPRAEMRLFRHQVSDSRKRGRLEVHYDASPEIIVTSRKPSPVNRALSHMAHCVEHGERPQSGMPEAHQVLEWMRRMRGIHASANCQAPEAGSGIPPFKCE
uniref:Uncharacterized protein n=1 Tax=Magnetococcus massalia (strain MO-1) TaxID=451514 RepID=A0A1S7LKE6_MAGMO|nr:Protein of unknown function. Containing oxidoreductase domain [Candidatus Magnetococcus massalia]